MNFKSFYIFSSKAEAEFTLDDKDYKFLIEFFVEEGFEDIFVVGSEYGHSERSVGFYPQDIYVTKILEKVSGKFQEISQEDFEDRHENGADVIEDAEKYVQENFSNDYN